MILALSGKMGSGKNTTANIIQYIIDSKESGFNLSESNYNDYIKNNHHLKCSFKQKSFAAKLKQIVALLTGCDIGDLEDQEFKMKKLGPEWTKFNKNWIYEGEIIKTAEASNLTVKELLDKGDYEHIVDDMYRATFMDTLDTYRELLQKVGTDALRNIVHEDIWVNALMCDYKLQGYSYTVENSKVSSEIEHLYPNWIITDMRFPNEAKAVEEKGGITIRVNGMYVRQGDGKATRTHPETGEHPSETALDNHKFQHVIDNDGSLSDLINNVREILILEEII